MTASIWWLVLPLTGLLIFGFALIVFARRRPTPYPFIHNKYKILRKGIIRRLAKHSSHYASYYPNFVRNNSDGENLAKLQIEMNRLRVDVLNLRCELDSVKERLHGDDFASENIVVWQPRDIEQNGAVLWGAIRLQKEFLAYFFELGTSRESLTPYAQQKFGGNDGPLIHVSHPIEGLQEGTTYYFRLGVLTAEGAVHGVTRSFMTRLHHAPRADTKGASFKGCTVVTANGAVSASNLPTRYFFEYGFQSTGLSSTTPTRPVGAALGARLELDFDSGPGSFVSYLEHSHHVVVPGQGFVRARLPENPKGLLAKEKGYDTKHVGLGPFLLIAQIDTGRSTSGKNDDGYFLNLGGGEADFRDAEVEMKLRGVGWRSGGCSVAVDVWSSATMPAGSAGKEAAGKITSGWCYTERSVWSGLDDGEWHWWRIKLVNDSTKWTCQGNDYKTYGKSGYDYLPLGKVLERHNTSLHLNGVDIDPDKLPEGAIDIGGLKITYRNSSLLAASNGARLTDWPATSMHDAAVLTDGMCGAANHGWTSVPNPSSPQAFVFEFAKVVVIDRIKIDQHPDWPSKDVQVLMTKDGSSYQVLANLHLSAANDGRRWGDRHTLVSLTPVDVVGLKFVITSGYYDRYWGLSGLEAFGTGADMCPDLEPISVNADITDVRPGTTVFYRLVAENGLGRNVGAMESATLPEHDRPWVGGAQAIDLGATTARIRGRINPMGHDAEIAVEYRQNADRTMKTKPLPVGYWDTPRHVVVTLEKLRPDREFSFRTVLTSDRGTTFGDWQTARTAAPVQTFPDDGTPSDGDR